MADSRNRQAVFPFGLLPLLGIILFFSAYYMVTRHTALVGGDSYTYARYARLLSTGHMQMTGPVYELIRAHALETDRVLTPVWNTALLPDGRWVYTIAPGYPLFLATLRVIGGDALMLNANILLQLLVMLLFAWAMMASLPRGYLGGAASLLGISLLWVLNAAVLQQFIQLWREPYMFVLLMGVALAVIELPRRRWTYWLIPFLLGAACAVKESNIIYAAWTAIVLLLMPSFRARPHLIRDIGLGGLLFIIGCSPLLLQNWYLTGAPWTSLYVLRETSEFSVAETGAGLSAGNLAMTFGRYMNMYQPYWPGLLPLGLMAVWGAWRWRKHPAGWLWCGWFILHVGLYLQWGNADFRHMYFANFAVIFFAMAGVTDLLSRPRWFQRWPALPTLVLVGLAMSIIASAYARRAPRPEFRMAQWRALGQEFESAITPDSAVFVNRPLRDILGIYTDLSIIRLHELLYATQRDPNDLLRRILQADVPIYFIASPDRDPSSIYRRIELSHLDWLYLYCAGDLLEVAQVDVANPRVGGYLGRPDISVYRIEPWSHYQLAESFEQPVGGGAFLYHEPRGLQDELVLKINQAPVAADARARPWITLSDIASASIDVEAVHRAAEPIPASFAWRVVDWYDPLMIRVGADALPADEWIFDRLPLVQRVQYRRELTDTVQLTLPIREGPNLFSVVRLEVGGRHEEYVTYPVTYADGSRFDAVLERGHVLIPFPPSDYTKQRRAEYQAVRLEVPEAFPLRVERLRSLSFTQTIDIAPEDWGSHGVILAGRSAPRPRLSADHQVDWGTKDSWGRSFVDWRPPSTDRDARWEWPDMGLTDFCLVPIPAQFDIGAGDCFTQPLLDGFHYLEEDEWDLFYWTKAKASLRLPVHAGSGTYTLRLVLSGSGLQPEHDVTVSWNGQTATHQVPLGPASYEWLLRDVPDDVDWIEVVLDTPGWSPTQHGSVDARELGVRWYGATWERVD